MVTGFLWGSEKGYTKASWRRSGKKTLRTVKKKKKKKKERKIV